MDTAMEMGLHDSECSLWPELRWPAGGSNVSENGPGGAPTVLRMILGSQLQALREKAGMSYEQAAEAIYSSPWTVRRMERAEGGLKPLTVKGLLMAYGITEPREIDAFLALARDACKPGWWHSYDDVLPDWFRTFIGLEEAASPDPRLRPALDTRPAADPRLRPRQRADRLPRRHRQEVERRVELRLARQQILDRPHPPRLWLVIDETALRRPAATTGPSVMRAQIGKLIEACQQPNITVQVLPFTAGLHPAMYGPFRIFRFDAAGTARHRLRREHDQRLLHRQARRGRQYGKALDRICAQAAPADETTGILTTIRKEI